MVSVKRRIDQYNREVGQPRGGLVKPSQMTAVPLADGHGVIDASLENVHPSTVGTAVDYLTRLARIDVPFDEWTHALFKTFRVSIRGARYIDEMFPQLGVRDAVEEALQRIPCVVDAAGNARADVNNEAVRAVCQLSTYDVAARNHPSLWNASDGPRGRVPDAVTRSHLRTMTDRTLRYLTDHGPIIADGFVFASGPDGGTGYTEVVDSGDGDFLTADTVWDIEVSTSKPNKDQVLQVLMYFLMGKASSQSEFASQTDIGILNPRLGIAYRLPVGDIADDIIATVRRDVIGYTE